MCHHLNGGPCLFNVKTDPAETKNLANDSAHAEILATMMARFKEMSATGMPMAGLSDNTALITQDHEWQCAVVQKDQYYRPYGPDIAWPHPSDYD